MDFLSSFVNKYDFDTLMEVEFINGGDWFSGLIKLFAVLDNGFELRY